MKNAFKKAFTGAVAVLTIVWSVGLANLPVAAQAASAGDLIKGTTLSTVYYYGGDGQRYAFPNEKTYFSWYEDFSDVQTISDSALADITLAGNIVYRPGSHWIKIQSDPKTYAVTTEGTIRWIETEEVAEGLAGSDWNAFIDDVSDTFFVDYTVGTSLMSADDAYEGALVADGSDTYLVWGGEKLLVSDMDDNAFQTRFVLDGASVDLDGMTTGDELADEDAAIVDTAQMGGVTTVADGGLSISLASDTQASTTIPATADSVPFATYKMTATEGAVDVSQLTFRLGGVGSVNNISSVYLYEGNDRLTNARSINSTTREVVFSSLDLSFTDGETKYITVRCDLPTSATTTAGDTVYFSLVDADAVETDGEVSGNFPISGNTMTFSDTDAGTLTIIDNGSISNPTLGEEGATIAKVKFSAVTEGASIEQVMFDVDNASDHSNFKLYDGSTLLANGSVDGKKVTFVLNTAYVIAKGSDKTLQVKADIGGEANEVISVAIEKSADVMATGSIYGFNMGIDVSGFDQTGNSSCLTECSESTIQGGKLTFAFNGPTSANIPVDSNDVSFLDFTLTAANWTQVQGIAVLVDGTDDDGTDDGLVQTDGDLNLQDITIRLEDGTVWMGPEELSASGSDNQQTLTFNDYQDMQAGDSLDLMITADVDSGAPSGDVFYMQITMASTQAEDMNGDDLTVSTDVVPTANIVGYNMTLTTSSMTIQESSTPTAGTYVKGTSDVQFAGYNFSAGTANDIEVTDVTFTIVGDDDGTFTDGVNDVVVSDKITSCSLYDSSTGSLIDGPEGIDTSSSVYSTTFADFSWTVSAGEIQKAVMKCNLANVATDAGSDAYKAAILATASTTNSAAVVSALDEEGDSVTVDYDVDDDGDTTNDSDDTITYATVGTTDAPEIDVVDAGALTVAAASDTPSSTIVLGNSTGVTVAKYKLTATNEAFVVQELQLVNNDGAVADDRAISMVTLSYTNSAGETETKTGSPSSTLVDFGGLDIYVPTTEARYVTVTVDTNSVSSTGATSGDTIDLDLDMAAGVMKIVGEGSGATILSGDACTSSVDCINAAATSDLLANTMTLYKTKPTISSSSSTPSGAIYNGNNEVFRFTVAADSRGYVTVNEIAFHLASTDVGATNWNVCDNTGGTTGIDATTVSATGGDLALYDVADLSTQLDDDTTDWTLWSGGVACVEDTDDVQYILANLATPDVIAAGSSVTYALYINVNSTGANSANDDTLRIGLETNSTTDAGITGTYGTLNWEDDSATGDIYATLLKTLPINGNALTF